MLAARKQWLAGHLQTRGTLVLDDGAVAALSLGHKSLLPVGVKLVQGSFRRGEMVVCVAPDGREIARGLATTARWKRRKSSGSRLRRLSVCWVTWRNRNWSTATT